MSVDVYSLMEDSLLGLGDYGNMKKLDLTKHKGISGVLLNEMLPRFYNLVSLSLRGIASVTDTTILTLASVALKLEKVNLSSCREVTDVSVVALAKSCPKLRGIKLANVPHLTDFAVSAIALECSEITKLDLARCALITDVSVRLVWIYLCNLRELYLSHCNLLTDHAFPSPTHLEPDPSKGLSYSFTDSKPTDLPPLMINRVSEIFRTLDLTECSLITDKAVEGIVSHAPQIRLLVLNKCRQLTNTAVESICKLGRHLHHLHLGHAGKITDDPIPLLVRSCPRIRYIDLAECTLLTDASVCELSSLPKLRRIGLVRIRQLTDHALYALADTRTLERIHLSYCHQLTVPAIQFLLLRLESLQHISLTGVPSFQQPELREFCREPPADLTIGQRMSFFVYSGDGVSRLRRFLITLFENSTEDRSELRNRLKEVPVLNEADLEYVEEGDDDDADREADSPEPEHALERATEEPSPPVAAPPGIDTLGNASRIFC